MPIPIGELTLFEKRIQGSLFGSSNPQRRHPARCSTSTTTGSSSSTSSSPSTYKLDEVAQGYEDMHAGKNIRGVLIFD